jgi:type VI secretion system protein ImpG
VSDSLLPYYERELDAIRRLAGRFAEAHPKVAGRLRLAADTADDPHVARLLEGAAFLAARVHHRLDDEFPELTEALLGLLYPQFLSPVPSCAIAQFACAPDALVPLMVRAGLALDAEKVRGEACRYRTAWATEVWPVEIESAALTGLPLAAPANPRAPGAVSVLRLALRCANPATGFAKLGIDRLRLFLRPAPGAPLRLYELLCGHAVGVALADGPNDPRPVLLGRDALRPVGFESQEALYPWPGHAFSGFRLLAEYFAFPTKFLFLDLVGLKAGTSGRAGDRMEVFVYLDRAAPELERAVGRESFALGCVPIVNLFPHRCEPVALTHEETDYRIVPDSRRPDALEVWSVEDVREIRADGSARPWRPLYGPAGRGADDSSPNPPGYFVTTRRPAPRPPGGTEVFLGPSDPAFDPNDPAAEQVLSIEALCTNRDLPAALPFGGGRQALQLAEGLANCKSVACITPPTAPLRPKKGDGTSWRLISHLSLGHLSVVGGADGAAALKEVLRLYDLRDAPETRAAIGGLVGVTARPGTARVPGARAGSFCRGLDVTLEFDRQAWEDGGLYLLAAVLDRFLALHATVNSFVRTRAALRGQPGAEASWPPRAGGRTLL